MPFYNNSQVIGTKALKARAECSQLFIRQIPSDRRGPEFLGKEIPVAVFIFWRIRPARFVPRFSVEEDLLKEGVLVIGNRDARFIGGPCALNASFKTKCRKGANPNTPFKDHIKIMRAQSFGYRNGLLCIFIEAACIRNGQSAN